MATVFVINDDPVQLHFLATLLEHDRHHVLRFKTAEEAYAALHDGRCADLVIVDLHLPGMDGRRFCRLLRASAKETLRSLPIVVVSATYSGPDAEQLQADLRIQAFLPLPMDPTVFRERIRRILLDGEAPASLQVLLVHQEEGDRLGLAAALVDMGWTVHPARSAAEARRIAGGLSVDLVVVVDAPPEMVGIDLVRELTRHHPSMSGVLIASEQGEPVRKEMLQSGVEAWCTQPIDPARVAAVCQSIRQDRVFARLEALLDRRTARLRDTEEQFQALFENLPDILIVYDAGRIIRHVNRIGARRLGYDPRELVGQSLGKIFPGLQALEGEVRASDGAGLGRHDWQERRFRTRDQDGIDVECLECPVTYEGNPGFLLVARDIGNRKRIEDEKRGLEHQLRQAQKMEAIGRLAAGVAHDVNNILAAILSHANVLKLSPKASAHLPQTIGVIEDAVRRGRQLTSQLLGFARQGKHHHLPVDVHGLIKELVLLLSRTVDKAVGIRMELEAGDHWVMGDPNQLYQVFLNLALNACDAMPQGGTLVVRTKNELVDERTANRTPGLSPGFSLVVTVEDSGVGIPPEIVNHVFEPFFTTKDHGKGSGMGLAMAYGIIKNHHGYIGVTSAVGTGTTMTLYLPCVERTAETAPSSLPAGSEPGQGHILIVDDEEAVASAAAELLEYLGYHVGVASDGSEALAYCRRHADTVEVVLLDLIMEGMNGSDCFKVLQAEFPQIRVIICSGYDRNHSIQDLLNRGAAGFIQKPYDITELSEVVKAVLDDAHQPSRNLALAYEPSMDVQ